MTRSIAVEYNTVEYSRVVCSLSSLGESLSSLLSWGTGPVARASEDIGFTALISRSGMMARNVRFKLNSLAKLVNHSWPAK